MPIPSVFGVKVGDSDLTFHEGYMNLGANVTVELIEFFKRLGTTLLGKERYWLRDDYKGYKKSEIFYAA